MWRSWERAELRHKKKKRGRIWVGGIKKRHLEKAGFVEPVVGKNKTNGGIVP